MPRMSGAEALVAGLEANGVRTVFGIPGVHTLPIYDALRASREIRHVLARHEQGAGFMAEGYARATGQVGIACVITGPGVTNIATPMADAYADSIPLLVIATSGPLAWTNRPAGDLHELKDQLGVMRSLAGWTRAVSSADEVQDALRDAFRSLTYGRPRGAYLEIPLDVLQDRTALQIAASERPLRKSPSGSQVQAAATLLRNASRPLIVAGAGVTASSGNESLRVLADTIQAPVLLGGKSRDVLPTSNTHVIAASGYGLTDELAELAERADVVLVVGSKLGDQRTGQGKITFRGKVIQIDIDPSEIGRRCRVDIGIAADAKATVVALQSALVDMTPRDVPPAAIDAVRRSIAAFARKQYGDSVAYLDAIRASLPEEGVVVADMVTLGYAAADCFIVHGPRTFVHASELCTIGCGLPQALGVKAGVGKPPVVALCGDGGFLLNLGEMATAVQEDLSVIVVLFNDGQYTAVKDEQRRAFGGRYFATDLVAPDYMALARAFGFDAARAESPRQLSDAITAALSHGRPTLIDTPLQRT